MRFVIKYKSPANLARKICDSIKNYNFFFRPSAKSKPFSQPSAPNLAQRYKKYLEYTNINYVFVGKSVIESQKVVGKT
jgi:hypothetical protein